MKHGNAKYFTSSADALTNERAAIYIGAGDQFVTDAVCRAQLHGMIIMRYFPLYSQDCSGLESLPTPVKPANKSYKLLMFQNFIKDFFIMKRRRVR